MSGLIDRCDEKAPEYRDISRFFGIRIGQKWREDETKKLKLFCDKSLDLYTPKRRIGVRITLSKPIPK
jgi:hypothetical protein